ncbi:efflux transporter, RND family, MFP subunit, related to HlyD [Desulfosarcina variabilis str. Montpellier]|uniref:efflux RND transporter periplasmic adaptor subunit n=1 Tax=Desulfosarcina variabilis TaxID=2300 RepID=UPI003AFB2018
MKDMNHENIKRPLQNIIFRILTCILILAAGIIGIKGLAGMKKPPATARNEEYALQVEAIRAQPADAPVRITGYGEVHALTVVPISPAVSGTIVETHPRLDEGEIIPMGETLFRIDPRNYEAAVKEARAVETQWENTIRRLKKQFAIDRQRLCTLQRNRKLAEMEFHRLRDLFHKDKVGTRSNVEKAEKAFNAAMDQVDQLNQALALYPIQIREALSSLASARARSSLAVANLERCTVAADFDARVKSVSIEKGQYVAPGQKALTLADDSTLEIHVPLDSRDARQWLQFAGSRKRGETAWFNGLVPVICSIRWTEADGRITWQGRLHRVVRFDQQTRTLTVAVRIDSNDAAVNDVKGLPVVEGMFCSVDIPGKTLNNIYRLPSWAVSYKNTVYKIQDSRLTTVPVTVARVDGDTAIVSEGLQPEDLVVSTRLADPLENILLEITNVDTLRRSS